MIRAMIRALICYFKGHKWVTFDLYPRPKWQCCSRCYQYEKAQKDDAP